MNLRFSFLFMFLFCFSSLLFPQTHPAINEFMASNLNWIADNDGDFDDWIEIYNPTDYSINLAGYYLTDDSNELDKWQIPNGHPDSTTIESNGYLLFWADNQPWEGPKHLGFKLSIDGEQIILVNTDGTTIIDSVTYQSQTANISQGRYPDGSESWLFYNVPSPGYGNDQGYFGVLDSVTFSPSAGLYNSLATINITNNDPESAIVYTLDGSNPDSLSHIFSDPLLLNSSSVVRARTMKANYIPGPIVSNVYFVDENFNLPVLTLITDPKNLFDDAIGIYVNYDSYGYDWERDVHVQYFKNKLEFSIPSGIRIQGSTSRFRAKKSFRLFFRDGYGQDRLEYGLFKDSPVQSFKNVVLRAGYDDDVQMTYGTLLRDPLVTETWYELNQFTSLSNFTALYINNDYWGVYNIRESINEFFFEDHLGFQNFDLMRFEKSRAVLKYGTSDAWNDFWTFIEASDFTNEDDYLEMQSRLDMENLLTLQALVQCTQYRSWNWGCFAYRESVPSGKWRLTIWDMDRAYTDVNWNGFTYYNSTTSEKWANLIVKKLLLNTDFKYAFLNRVADYLNSVCSTENMLTRLDSLVAIIEPEMPKEVERWNQTLTKWETNVERLRNFARQRPDIVRNQALSQYGIDDTIRVVLNANTEGGYLKLNTTSVIKFPWSGIYFTDIPITIEAIPKPGYKFSGWIPDTYPADQRILTISSAENVNLQAIFETDPSINIVINEINYNAHSEMDPGDWIELYNPNDSPVDISNCILKDQNAAGNTFQIPASQTLDAFGYIVLCASITDFQQIFPDVQNCIGDFGGATGFGFSGSGEQIQLLNADYQVLDQVTYDDAPPWPSEADGLGYTLELNDPNDDNALAENWQASSILGGSPGQINSITDIESDKTNELPVRYKLYQNYPNPFNPNTTICYDLPTAGRVNLSIFNILGQKVTILISGEQNRGNYKVKWNANEFSSGIYFYQLQTKDFIAVGKMILMQ